MPSSLQTFARLASTRHVPTLMRHCLAHGEPRAAKALLEANGGALTLDPALVEDMLASGHPWALRLLATHLPDIPGPLAHRIATARKHRETWTALIERATLDRATQQLMAAKGNTAIKGMLLTRRDLDDDIRDQVAVDLLADTSDDRQVAGLQQTAARRVVANWPLRRANPTLLPGPACPPALRTADRTTARWAQDATEEELIGEIAMILTPDTHRTVNDVLDLVQKWRPDARPALNPTVIAHLSGTGKVQRNRKPSLSTVELWDRTDLTAEQLLAVPKGRWRGAAAAAAIGRALDSPDPEAALLAIHTARPNRTIHAISRCSVPTQRRALRILLPHLPEDGLFETVGTGRRRLAVNAELVANAAAALPDPDVRRRWLEVSVGSTGQHGWRQWSDDDGGRALLDQVIGDPDRVQVLLAAADRCRTVKEVDAVMGTVMR